jgi:hypothetical protein
MDVAAGLFGGTQGTEESRECPGRGGGGPVRVSDATPGRLVMCGFPSSGDNGFWDPRCGSPRRCPRGELLGWLVQQGRNWVLDSVWCPSKPAPVPTTEALREEAIQLLPAIQIGSAWTTRALVNAQAIFWAETDADRSLPTATVVGRQVQLRIGFDHADWTFGDGATDTTTDPGTPYSEANPCDTAQCPGYYGHTYTDTGPVTITLTVAWNAQFSLDGGATWTDVDAVPLTGPQTTHALDVVQARGILVQDPGR